MKNLTEVTLMGELILFKKDFEDKVIGLIYIGLVNIIYTSMKLGLKLQALVMWYYIFTLFL